MQQLRTEEGEKMQNKVLTYKDNERGRSQMAVDLEIWSRQGWQVVSQTVSEGNYGLGKTCCLGCIFLPLSLLGKKSGTITLILAYNPKPLPTHPNQQMPVSQNSYTNPS